MKGKQIDDTILNKVGGGFEQKDPGPFLQMLTQLSPWEARVLNEKFNLKGEKKFFPGVWYDRDEFAERGIDSSSGRSLASKLEDFGFYHKK